MKTSTNKTTEILKKLEAQNNIKPLSDSEYIKIMRKLHEDMEEIHRDFLQRNALSEKSAKKCFVW